jgi:TolB-like protein
VKLWEIRPDHPRFVETLPRHGYRLIGKIKSYDEPPSADIGPVPSEASPAIATESVDEGKTARSVPPTSTSPRRLSSVFFVLTILLAKSLTALLLFRKSRDPHTAAQAAGIRSIAVLPLESLSGNPAQQYFADGMIDELITELAKTKGLRVISRTSVMQYKGVHRPMKDIARELGVDGILEGSVVDAGGRVRVTVQLVHAASDNHVWAQSYIRDLSDLLLLQQEIAENVEREVNSSALPSIASSRRIAPEHMMRICAGGTIGTRATMTLHVSPSRKL